ncbi:uncharacterized protein LODBEIA_P58910 [Lodderomyces beijingensis]|uniref:Ribosomal protein/NADH dehydrogenase domain-containing protein n=1 Tax=Lodderomyces beijingensis TaxID=1775926 RepID=A0ABP0ZU64_9ASCO
MSAKGLQNYSLPLRKQIAKINTLRGTPETSFKFDASKYKEFEMFIYHQTPVVYKPAHGIRSFWKKSMPTLRYHNPQIQVTVNAVVVDDEKDLVKIPLKLKIHGHKPEDNAVIDCASKSPSQILAELVELTNARRMTQDEIPLISTKPPTARS